MKYVSDVGLHTHTVHIHMESLLVFLSLSVSLFCPSLCVPFSLYLCLSLSVSPLFLSSSLPLTRLVPSSGIVATYY